MNIPSPTGSSHNIQLKHLKQTQEPASTPRALPIHKPLQNISQQNSRNGLDTTCPTDSRQSPKHAKSIGDHTDQPPQNTQRSHRPAASTHATTGHDAAHHAVSKTCKNSQKAPQNALKRNSVKPPGLPTQNRQQPNN